MFKRLQTRRAVLLLLALLTGFVGLGLRLVDLQVLRHEDLRARAVRNVTRAYVLEPLRGDLRDRRGNPLATSVFVKTVAADPLFMQGHHATVARALAPVLQCPEAELADRLRIRTRTTEDGRTVTNRYVVLQRKVSAETWARVQDTMRQLDFGVDETTLPRPQQKFFRDLRAAAVFTDPVDDQLRVYPNGTLAAHVLGFTGMDEVEVHGIPMTQLAGKEGMELTLDQQLRGVAGWRQTETDRWKRELVTARGQDVEPRDGLHAILTVDSVLQHILESEVAQAHADHTPLSTSGVILQPRTGEILAMATLPTFDPSRPGDALPDHRRNRIATDVMEPGSTFKIVPIAGALSDRAVALEEIFNCENGAFFYGGRTLRDHHPYGLLSVEGIITKSSNIGAAKIGLRLGDHRLQHHIRNFGFGERTGVPLPGEVPGIVHEVKDWSKVTIAQLPMGHGIAVTRLQMMMAMAAVANEGRLMRPMLVSHLETREGEVMARYTPQYVRQVISTNAARQMVRALKTVVAPGGTATKAALAHHTVAGKTGTAQKPGPGGYMPGKYVSSFIGFFPADDPQLCIGIFFDEPAHGYFGGTVAAPVFQRVAERSAAYLGVPADDLIGQSQAVPAENPEEPRLRTAYNVN